MHYFIQFKYNFKSYREKIGGLTSMKICTTVSVYIVGVFL